ncbi:MAG: hypothetical protein OXL68_21375 [Paracoccaceae bacterium]|nr:hypothetical protein [Paracoccaceae bacterium]
MRSESGAGILPNRPIRATVVEWRRDRRRDRVLLEGWSEREWMIQRQKAANG